jgi:hypothetical protein
LALWKAAAVAVKNDGAASEPMSALQLAQTLLAFADRPHELGAMSSAGPAAVT